MSWDVLAEARRRLGSLLRRDAGTSAVEFSLFAPAIIFGVVTMGDVGLALHQRLSLDHVVRAGAHAAMADPGEDQVMNVLRATASEDFTVDSGQEGDLSVVSDPVTLSVSRYCACPDNRSVAVVCSDICSDTVPPFVFYHMSAAKAYNGLFMPSFALAREIDVQIR